MSDAFAKDSTTCAVCQSWGGDRALSADKTLVRVGTRGATGECRGGKSQDYGKITKSSHTCDKWSPLPEMRAHGGRHSRTPGPSAAMAGVLAAPGRIGPQRDLERESGAAPSLAAPSPAVPSPAAQPPIVEGCQSAELDIERTPPTARVLYAYWHRLKGDRDMPTAAEIDTAKVRDVQARLCVFRRAKDGDFTYRACGAAVARRMKMAVAGRRLAECHAEEVAARLRDDLEGCLRARAARALLVRGDDIVPGQKFVELLLPLADDRGEPTLVLAYRHVPGA